MKESDKELLTKAHIIIDLKKRYINEIKRYAIATVTAASIFIFFLLLITDRTITFEIVLTSIFLIFLPVIMSTFLLYNIYKYFSAIKNFKIEIANISNKKNIYHLRLHTGIRADNYTYLYFSNDKRFQVIPFLSFSFKSNYFYSWSKFHQMDEIEFFNCGKPGDNVYLITNKNKIIYVYYEKYFTLDNELSNLSNN